MSGELLYRNYNDNCALAAAAVGLLDDESDSVLKNDVTPLTVDLNCALNSNCAGEVIQPLAGSCAVLEYTPVAASVEMRPAVKQ